MNSIRNKFTNFASLIQNSVDVLVIAETKLDASFPTSQFEIPGFIGSVSSSIPCTCRLLLANLCLPPFSWPMKMATTKGNQETTRARNAG